MVKYVIGDIHGCYNLLIEAEALIVANIEERGYDRSDVTVIYLGDYCDRGPDSNGVINHLMHHPIEGVMPVHLKGNHEEMMFKAVEHSLTSMAWKLSGSDWRQQWIENGGIATILSYGVERPDVKTHHEWFEADTWDWDVICDAVPEEQIHWMKRLPNTYVDGKYFFVHAGVDPRRPLFGQTTEYLWVRNVFLNHTAPFTDEHGNEFIVVHGHTPTNDGRPDIRHNQINMDTGMVFNGEAYVLVIDDDYQYDLLVTEKFPFEELK